MFKRLILCVVSVFIFSNCSGGGNGGVANPGETVTVSGLVTYTHYKTTQDGIDYNNPIEKPIRGAIAELRNSSGVVLQSGNTSATGAYSFSAPASAALSIVIKAALGTPGTPRLRVVDNTDGGKLYALALNITSGTSNLTQNFNANSGWDGSSYAGLRTSAPFAILDSIYQAERLVLSVDPTATFPGLTVNWSKNNIPASGDKTLGQITTSHYTANELYILGAENIDTDEYDASIITHEWSHYFEDNLSRTDSIGGSHGTDDILDPRLAFGEGFGNAFSGMVLNDPLYIDTVGASQESVGVGMNLDADSVIDGSRLNGGIFLDGFYSEFSVQEVLYDLFDSGVSDDDNIGLGFKPIYDVMVGGQKTTPAFTSIFSFLKYLKDTNLGISADITALAAGENIGSGAGNEDEFEDLGLGRRIYTTIPVDAPPLLLDVDGDPLQTWSIYGPITANNPGNKLYNRMFFRFSIPASRNYTIEVSSVGSDDVGFTLNEKGSKTFVDSLNGGGTERLIKSLSPSLYSMDIYSFGKATEFTVRIF
ncbi:Phage tail fiber protein [hydrothermal vent metagenome]|uniref:Phage tail fiber protein n=1 Tax=hydrothermal vent metagenome TaxID=652676 RepID=A0A3B1DTA1_9ZZZZ